MDEPFQYDIFISYSSANVSEAAALETLLKAAGLNVWRDKSELRPGDHVEFSVPEALRKSATVAVLWSREQHQFGLGQSTKPATPLWKARR